jgi:CelD/BcsL family acetyltransferase involved in cellulose biosynthesis
MSMMFLTDARVVTAGGCKVDVVTDLARLSQLQQEWTDLFHASPTASPPLRYEWVRQWWEIYGPLYGDRGRGLRVLAIRRADRLIGILPLYHHPFGGPLNLSRLQFVSAGAAEFEETCADYLNLLHARGEGEICTRAVAEVLASGQLRWDELDLLDIPADSPLVELKNLLARDSRHVEVRELGVCYISDLSGGMDQYLAGLSYKARRKARKMLKQIEETKGLKFEVAKTEQQIGTYFDEMIQLHRKRWAAEGKTGSFAPNHEAFHRALGTELGPRGAVAVGRLSFEDRPMAVVYGHVVGKKFDGYQTGVDHEQCSILKSPGAAAHFSMMAYLASQNVVEYDSLRGSNLFKEEYAKNRRMMVRLTAGRQSLRSTLFNAADFGRRGLRKVISSLARPAPTVASPAVVPEKAQENVEDQA